MTLRYTFFFKTNPTNPTQVPPVAIAKQADHLYPAWNSPSQGHYDDATAAADDDDQDDGDYEDDDDDNDNIDVMMIMISKTLF